MNVSSARPVLVFAACLFAVASSRGAEAATAAAVDVPPSVLKRYDRNKNGTLDAEEQAKWESDKAARREKDRAERAAMLEKYDSDKDGKLSEDEKASAKLGWQRERAEKEAEKMKERAAKAKAERERVEKEKASSESAEKAADAGMMMMSE